jgi:CheY-like chemotaxis protein
MRGRRAARTSNLRDIAASPVEAARGTARGRTFALRRKGACIGLTSGDAEGPGSSLGAPLAPVAVMDRVNAPPDAADEGREGLPRPSTSSTFLRPRRVLLVDDERDGREICADYLGSQGFEVLQAEGGADAIDVAIKRHPDLIVMDLEMPRMTGLEAVRRLKADPRTRAIPVILLTGSARVDFATVGEAGCVACLLKPCDLVDLAGVIAATAEVRAAEPGRGRIPA